MGIGLLSRFSLSGTRLLLIFMYMSQLNQISFKMKEVISTYFIKLIEYVQKFLIGINLEAS